jgi:hypothetical protein
MLIIKVLPGYVHNCRHNIIAKKNRYHGAPKQAHRISVKQANAGLDKEIDPWVQ